MGKLKNNQSGFGAVEGILVLVIVVLIGVVGYMVYHNHKTKTTPAVSKTVAKSTTSAKKTPATNQASSTQYLTVKEFGIKIPLTSSTSDLGYIYNSSGYNNLPYITLGSKTLAQEAMKDDPANCTQARLNETNGLYPISYVYSTKWEVDGGGGQGISQATATVGGKGYYWYGLNAGAGCDVSGTSLTNDLTTYYNTVLSSFPSSVAE